MYDLSYCNCVLKFRSLFRWWRLSCHLPWLQSNTSRHWGVPGTCMNWAIVTMSLYAGHCFAGGAFLRTYATGAACQQRTLTPPDTWSCPTLGLAYVLMSRPIFPELVLSPDFWISNTPRYFSFASCHLPWLQSYESRHRVAFIIWLNYWNCFLIFRSLFRWWCLSCHLPWLQSYESRQRVDFMEWNFDQSTNTRTPTRSPGVSKYEYSQQD